MQFWKRKRFCIPALAIMLPVLAIAICGLSFLFSLDAVQAAAERQPSDATIRQIEQGEIIGFRTDGGIDIWTGIPFAADVSGDKRWSMPEAYPAWEGRRSFTETPERCVQLGGPSEELPKEGFFGSEDCLTLDVMAPAGISDLAKAKLPVLFSIHGGGNSIGEPGNLDRSLLVPEQNVIMVSPRYRLGPFGFFSHPALRAAGIPTANFAIEDQILALKWVQKNIAAFGGDPENVTIAGQSAGARNVLALMLSPHAEGLFGKAIMESGMSTTLPADMAEKPASEGGPRNNSTDVVKRLLVRLGKADNEMAAAELARTMTDAEMLAFLREVPAPDFMAVYQKNEKDRMYGIPATIRDGFTIPLAAPEDLLGEGGAIANVPLLIGSNQNELGMLMLFNPHYSKSGLFKIPNVLDPERFDRVSSLIARGWKYTGVDRIADWWSAKGDAPVFVYRFDWNEQPKLFGVDAGRFVGAAHNYELPFVFGQFSDAGIPRFFLTKDNAEGRETLSSQMRGYWGSFIRSGTPNSADGPGAEALPIWPEWQRDAPRNMLLDTENDGGLHVRSLYEEKAAFEKALIEDPILDGYDRCYLLNILTVTEVWTNEELNALGLDACRKAAAEAEAKE